MDKFQSSTFISFLFTVVVMVAMTMTMVVNSATLTLVNECTYTVWPGILSSAGEPALSTTGLALQSGNSTEISASSSWSGRVWGRTLCSLNSTTNRFSCLTADCGTGTVACSGNGASPPATLVELTLGGYNGNDYYDVSLVDGYNLPMSVDPVGGTGNCTAAGCYADLNESCPTSLRVVNEAGDDGESVACRSACDAFGDAEYCCSGAYASPDTCKPTSYSEYFKSACPAAYSYAFDDATSIFTCSGADYVITFCPTAATTTKKSTADDTVFAAGSYILGSMFFLPALTAILITSPLPYRLL
ncbi:hypothetical protein Dimus_014097 [Dionaea muscipula]